MILAGDIGGTKSLMGVFRPHPDRPQASVVREYATTDFDGLLDLVRTFLDESGMTGITSACFGVAGPVRGLTARLTNVPWLADAIPVAEHLRCRTSLVNDLEAMAGVVPVLEPDELAVLQGGDPLPGGNAALIAAGTGLGEALMHNVDGRFIPSPSEGGHADFAPRTPREFELARSLMRAYGRVENERVISGPGIVNIYRFTHGANNGDHRCEAVGAIDEDELPAAVTLAALGRRCDRCVETLEIFIEAYGSEAGNLALRSMATAGVYLGGGIAPKLLAALGTGLFIDAFRDKPPMTDLLRTIPVWVIVNPSAGLVGAAVAAASAAEPT